MYIYIKNTVSNKYIVNIVDKSRDGILALTMKHKQTDYSYLLIGAYLPPAQSTWGRDAIGFYAHIMNLLYVYNECDMVILTGDLNSRIGSECDYIPEIDDINSRTVLDKTKNKHGTVLLDFLMDAKMCVCNGRVSPEFDNFTFVEPNRGSSVVDYFIVPIECYDKCVKLQIHTTLEMINKHCAAANIDIGKPDHSVLVLTVQSGPVVNGQPNLPAGTPDQHRCDEHSQAVSDIDQNHVYYRRYNVKFTPEGFLGTDVTLRALVDKIEQIEVYRVRKVEIDTVYNDLCKMYHDEMNVWFKFRNVHPYALKKLRKCSKPFWNDELTRLWKILCDAEKPYLKAQGPRRVLLRQQFHEAQTNFNKVYRKAERKFKRDKIIKIESVSTSDPNKFWAYLKKLSPRMKKDIPLEIYREDGSIENDVVKVLEKWREEYARL